MPLSKSPEVEGLSATTAAERLRTEGYNELPSPDKRHFGRILLDVAKEPMLALLIGGGLVYLLLGDPLEALMLLLFATFSVSITLVQQSRSERVLETLRNLASPRARVIRDGRVQQIAGRELVRGDLMLLSEGARVAADAQLQLAHDLLLDESLLTGESVPVTKNAAPTTAISAADTATASNAAADKPTPVHSPQRVYAGTLVVRGSGQAQVISTGAHTEIGRLGEALNSIENEQPHLKRQLTGFVRTFALLGGAAALITVLLYGTLRGSWLEALLRGIALSMSMMPAEIPVVLAVFMAMGAWRISLARVLTRRASAIETLGATTVLCTDKTGTLTANQMTLVAMQHSRVTWRADAKQTEPLSTAAQSLLEAAVLSCPLQSADPMDVAVQTLAQQLLPASLGALQQRPLVHTFGLRPELLAITRLLTDADGAGVTAYSKGALEAIARLCQLSEPALSAATAAADAMATQGMRILGVASARPASGTPQPDSPLQLRFEVHGLLGFADPLRPTVPAAVAQCHSAGIRVVMITGDYALTATAIAAQAGIDATSLLTGEQIDALSDAELAAKLKTTRVFARIHPVQKLRIVNGLKADGEVVAMTGDGVNDAPAIKAAHIGIAMGKRGTDVAREASALVLLDDDFGAIVTSIRLGRRIYDNLRKAIEFIVAVHIPTAGLALLPLLTGLPLILAPIHIAFLEMIIDPACSIVFEAEAAEPDTMQRPPRNPKSPLLQRQRMLWGILQGGIVFTVLAAILIAGANLNMAEQNLRALVFYTLVTSNMGLILVNRSFSASLWNAIIRPNRSLWLLMSLVTAVLTAALFWPPAQRLFGFGQLAWWQLILGGTASLLSVLMLETLKVLWFGPQQSGRTAGAG